MKKTKGPSKLYECNMLVVAVVVVIMTFMPIILQNNFMEEIQNDGTAEIQR